MILDGFDKTLFDPGDGSSDGNYGDLLYVLNMDLVGGIPNISCWTILDLPLRNWMCTSHQIFPVARC